MSERLDIVSIPDLQSPQISRPITLLENGRLVCYGPNGRIILFRIANGLAIFWDRRAKCEYVAGHATVDGSSITLTLGLASLWTGFPPEETGLPIEGNSDSV